MMDRSLSALDLNLLLVLEALLAERSVTRAARRLGLSQSATSHALARLRSVLDDPLFVRTATGLVPTEQAQRLAGPLAVAFGELRAALAEPAPFDPAAASGTVRICAADLAQTLVVPELCAIVAERAPGVLLVVTGFPDDTFQRLAQGQADLALGLPPPGPDLQQQLLMSQPFCCLVREDHPCLAEGPNERALSLETYTALGHVLLSPRGLPRGYVDRALQKLGQQRRVVLVTPQLLPAARAVALTDLVLTAPERMARWAASILPLQALSPPLEIEPFPLAMSWHDRRSADPLHAWIRQAIAGLGQGTGS